MRTICVVPLGGQQFFAVFGGDQASWATVAALLGGTLAATSHVAKATTRAAVNTSPEPFSNIALSLAGDALVPAMLWLAVQQPLWFGLALALFVVVGLVLIALAATGTVGVWGWIGVVPLLTGVIHWCPVYTLLGINSCPLKKSR